MCVETEEYEMDTNILNNGFGQKQFVVLNKKLAEVQQLRTEKKEEELRELIGMNF